MRYLRLTMGTILLSAVAVGLSGCPVGQSDTFEIWLINGSGESMVVNTSITDNANNNNMMEFPDDVATKTTHIFADISTEGFQDDTITVTVVGDSGGDGLLPGGGDEEATVDVPQAIQAGVVIPILVTGGGNAGDLNAEYLPLDQQSAGKELLEHDLMTGNIAN